MENWRLRDMIWNFTPALKFAFIWPEYLAIVLIFLISQFNPFWSFSKSTCKETKLKIVQCDWPSVWECQPSELWSQRLQDISTQGISAPNFNPGLFNHKLFNYEYLLQPGTFQPWTLQPRNFQSWTFQPQTTLHC